MTDNPVRTLATLALAACLALGLVTPAGAAPTPSTAGALGAPSVGGGAEDTLALRDEFFGTATAGARTYSARAALPRPEWDASLPQGRECTDLVCLHYVGVSGDAPPMASSTGGTPDWVALTLSTASASFARMGQLGWPMPPSDRGAGGTPQFDIYLQDLGRRGLYGYCAPEQVVPGERNVASSYCVLDNDFVEFPLPPTPSMRVTVAHELFHAVQFGLDAREDGWFLEASATWMEEQITDDVNDNRQYLRHGQLGDPGTPLDTFDSGLGSYGNWIFFQRLTQRFGGQAVRQVWARADGHVGRRNDFSVRAIKRYVESRGVSWPRFYAGFVAANRTARSSYAEGSSYRPSAPQARVRLGRGRGTWSRTVTLDHLTGQALSLRPSPGLRRGR
ncbi:MXAN_6640 family putative metalloprotease, partial [Nocardioides sp. P5_C9_2]